MAPPAERRSGNTAKQGVSELVCATLEEASVSESAPYLATRKNFGGTRRGCRGRRGARGPLRPDKSTPRSASLDGDGRTAHRCELERRALRQELTSRDQRPRGARGNRNLRSARRLAGGGYMASGRVRLRVRRRIAAEECSINHWLGRCNVMPLPGTNKSVAYGKNSTKADLARTPVLQRFSTSCIRARFERRPSIDNTRRDARLPEAATAGARPARRSGDAVRAPFAPPYLHAIH